MRYTPQHKEETRERILRAAARQFRERGFAETGVASVMKEAELTHGGFYAHFQSKDDLIAEVIHSGFDQVSDRFESRFDHLSGIDWLRVWVERYLSDSHRDKTGEGCPFPALAPEIARSGPVARTAFTEIFLKRLKKICSHIDAPADEAETRVFAAIAQMVGALMLSRALDEPLSTRVREAASEASIRTLIGGQTSVDDQNERGAS
ncbi:MAG: TetR/AcrR family transcriptional regulator [Phycisphaerales bacterium]|nr:TetR/AcrR family transcriptional regulator [Phycisphaerales bacterium]